MNEKAIYKMVVDYYEFHYEGIFIATKEKMQELKDSKLKIDFQHMSHYFSRYPVYIDLFEDESTITFITDSPIIINIFEKHKLSTGINPFDIKVYEHPCIDVNSKNNFPTVGEILDIL